MSVLLKHGMVFDGHEVVGERDVLVEDGRIAAIGRGLEVTGETWVYDCRDHTVVPGMIDAHVHVAWAGIDPPPDDVTAATERAIRNASLLLRAGVTTVRDTGGPLEVLAPLAQMIAAREVAGPYLLHCGRILCAPGGHGTEVPLPVPIARECSGPEAFRAGVRDQVEGGAHWIKVALNGARGDVELTREELLAVVDEAHALGVRVACHASVRDAIMLAVTCGVNTIEHGNGIDVELAEQMASKGIGLVPTATIFRELADQLDGSPFGDLSNEERAAHRRALDQRLAEHPPAIAAADAARVTIGFGTDRVPGGQVVATAAEARALRDSGLTTPQVLRAATSGNAQLLGLEDRGVIGVGARADLAVFPGDVMADPEMLHAPVLVLQGGTVHVPESL